MDNLEKYEYKHPSFELLQRNITTDNDNQKKLRRYTFDDQKQEYTSLSSEKDEITLLFAGDLLCQESIFHNYKTKDGFDFSLCFKYVKPLFQSVDFVAGNLETPISQSSPYRGEIMTHEGPFYCNAPIEYLQALSEASFDMLTTANNHTIDAGVRGLIETIENIKGFDMIQTGTFKEKEDKYILVNICGFKIGFTAFSTYYNSMDENMTNLGKEELLNTYTYGDAKKIYDELKSKGAEYIICFPHWGKEFTDNITPTQQRIASELTSIGYDCVVGSHAHVIQKYDIIHDKPVLYSLGNLISHLNISKKNEDSAPYTVLFLLKLKRENEKILPTVEMIPCKIMKDYHGIPFTVIPLVKQFKNSKISFTTESVQKLLDTPNQIINDNFSINEEAYKEFIQVDQELEAKTSQLLHSKNEIKPIDISLDALLSRYKSLKKKNKYVKNGNNFYQINEDEADLVFLASQAATVKIPVTVKGKPVIQISNLNEKNKTTQIIYLSKHVKTIGKEAFKNYSNLESVRIFDSLESIEERAFENCIRMTGMILPKTMKRIGEYAFLGCENLLSIKIPDNVESIASNAFEGCSKLTIYCNPGSYGEQYAKEHQIPVQYMPLKSGKSSSKTEVKKDAPKQNKINPNVKYGPMNHLDDKHPKPIIASCYYLGVPLPKYAKCKNQPSKYIVKGTFDGELSTIKKALGRKMPKIDNERLSKEFRLFKNKFKTQECLTYNKTNLSVYFTDYLLFCRPRGFSHNDYFDFELYNKEMDARDTFLDEKFRLHIYKVCADKNYRDTFKDKPRFNEKFSEFVKRDWIVASRCSFEEFKQFVEKHETFFAKPIGRTGGKGARIINRNMDTIENLYLTCKNEDLLAEEIIEQHPELAKFNESTLNTVRVLTLVDAKNEVHVLLAVARFGRAGNVVDNFHGGGVGAIVDIKSGKVISEAINQNHIRSDVHPDSKLSILGFQYPKWEEIIETVKKAALVIPQVRNVGWDVAVTKDGRVEIVEGNSRSGFDVLQSPDQVGRKYLYDPYLKDLETIHHYKAPKPLNISIAHKERSAYTNIIIQLKKALRKINK